MRTLVKVYGPYLDGTGKRRIVIRMYDDGTRETTAHARHLIEQHLGRELGEHEEVDHIDEDPLNDDLSNLQVLSTKEHRAKTAVGRVREMVTIICARCGDPAIKEARNVRSNAKKGRGGPYCGRRCAGLASAEPR